jgi:hypothetical protein
VSPISQLTNPGSSPSTAPAIWGKIVSVPVPMSWKPDSTVALPSALMRTCARDWLRKQPIAQSAIPCPTSQ